MLSFQPVGAALAIIYAAAALGIGYKRRIPIRRQLLPFILFLYLLAAVAVTLFPVPVEPGIREYEAAHNLVPFKSIIGFMRTWSVNTLVNVAGNILLFGPFGFLLPLLAKRLNRTATIVALGFAASLTIELSQLAISAIIGMTYRSFDVDDLILNTLGVIVGYSLLRVVQLLMPRLRQAKKTLALGIAALILASAGGYAYTQHSTPEKALEAHAPNVLPLASVPFAKGVVLITPTDPALFDQPGYVAWYMQRHFWGWQVESHALAPITDRTSFGSLVRDGETFLWGMASNQRIDQIVYRHAANTYKSPVTQRGLWHLILPFAQTEFPPADWSTVLQDGTTAPLFTQAN